MRPFMRKPGSHLGSILAIKSWFPELLSTHLGSPDALFSQPWCPCLKYLLSCINLYSSFKIHLSTFSGQQPRFIPSPILAETEYLFLETFIIMKTGLHRKSILTFWSPMENNVGERNFLFILELRIIYHS